MSEQEGRGEETPATRTGDNIAPEPIEAARSLDRFQILSVAGTGGMGRVYVAFDPQLDRRVALKVVHGSKNPKHQERAAREAKALARVSHQNVVAIHDVHEHDGQLLIAMEFVSGRTLKEWMKEHAPSEKPQWLLGALDVLLQAGSGLAAAHAAELVHRDFKPSNVLVGDDGRVRVVDFGLARDATHSPGVNATREGIGSSSDDQVTKTGTVVGTPAYMAPEQTQGRTLDGRTDQYAFCVTAWEVLFGVRPQDAALQRSAPSAVPAGVEKALRKGMSNSPSGRFAGMAELLARLAVERDALHGGQRRSSRWWLLAAVVGAGSTWAWMSRDTNPCADEGGELAAVWGSERSEEVRKVFLDSGLPYAESSWIRVEESVERYAEQWIAAQQGACEAAQRGRPLPTAAGTLGCLAQRRRALAAYLDVVGEGTPEALAEAALAAEQLPDPAACLEADFVLSGFETPEGETAVEVSEVREVLARSAALRKAGQYQRAEALTLEAEERVRRIDYPPLSQDYALEQASIPRAVPNGALDEQLLVEVYVGASQADRGQVATEAASRLALALANQGETKDAQRWLKLASATDIDEPTAQLRGELCGMRGKVLALAGEFNAAVEVLSRCVAVEERRLGENAAGLAGPLSDLGAALLDEGRYAEAEASLERALRLARTLGESHPQVGHALHARFTLAVQLEQADRAQALAAEELPIFQATYGDLHPMTGIALVDAAWAANAQGQKESSLALFEQALAVYEAGGSAHDYDRSFALTQMAAPLRDLGRRDEAAARIEQAYSIRRNLLPESHRVVIYALHDLAFARSNQGRFDEALDLYSRVRDLMIQNFGADHPDLELVEGGLGGVLLHLERYAEATRMFERELGRIRSSHGPDSPARAQPLYNLGLCAEGLDKLPEAQRSYTESLAALESMDLPSNPMLSYPLIGLARVAVADERPLDAIAHAERAMPLTKGDAVLRADAQAVLARGLWSAGGERVRARKLANMAQESYVEIGAAADGNREDLERWRDEHGL